MKTNEAPEILYVDATDNPNDVWLRAFRQPFKKCGIEYTRTDVFIEKAVQYLKDHKEEVETEDNGIAGWIPDYFIKDFKNYMKGE